MRNTLAIADKEVRSYFAVADRVHHHRPVRALFGFFFYVYLMAFNQQSQQMMQFGGGGGANINQMMIRGLFQNAAVIILFVMPMITMRTYSEEKRSGTIELLLTSPVSDLEIILGKYLGALTLYATMLLVTMIYMGILFKIGQPEWRPIATGYLGLLLMGGCFLSAGLLISSLTKKPDRRGVPDLRDVPDALDHQLARRVLRPHDPRPAELPVDHAALRRLRRGVIDTKDVAYYLSFITFGLFLTAKSVDSERWRG
jgi:ABC-2 type transport system permease protein